MQENEVMQLYLKQISQLKISQIKMSFFPN